MKLLQQIIIIFSSTLIFSNSIFSQEKELDKYFQKSLNEWKIPGMAIAIVKNDSVIFSKGYGVKDITKKDKVDDNTLFGIASNTKAFTSAAIALLVEDNKLNWNDKVQKYLPYFEMYNNYVSNNITITDLLCHRSGLETFSGDLLWYASNYKRNDIVRRIKYLKPKYGFRITYGYSNLLFLTAGEIIPTLTKKTWDEFLNERFFQPLKMTSTNTSITNFGNNTNIAQPHIMLDENPRKINYVNWDNIAPAGAINSNVVDMSNWIRMLLNKGLFEGKVVISNESLKKLWSPQTIKEIGRFEELYAPSTHFSTYGLGWELMDYHGYKIVNHSGGLDGMISKVVLVPEENLGFVILTNSTNWLPDALMYKILDNYLSNNDFDWSNLYYQFYLGNKKYDKEEFEAKEKARNKNTKPTLKLENYTGTYNSILYGDAEIKFENGKLKMQLIPTPDFYSNLEHWQSDTFSIKFEKFPSLPQGTVSFIINENTEVTNMKIDVPNPDFDFTELEFIKIK